MAILKLVTAPASEPVTLTEAKAHLRVDGTDDDTLITVLIAAARQYYEDACRRMLITQTWRLSLDCWPANSLIIPKMPLITVSAIAYTDSAGATHTLSTDVYDVDTEAQPGRVTLAYNQSWPSVELYPLNPIQITFTAGYGAAASVPEVDKQAIKLLVGHWYENREPVVTTGAAPKDIPMAVESLIYLNRGYV